MFELAQENGVQLVQGIVTEIRHTSTEVTSVLYRDANSVEQNVPATDVIICAGAWAPRIIESLPIEATRAHSVTIHPQKGVQISPYVLFTEIRGKSLTTPEIYARPDNEVYACGTGDSSELPESVDDVEVDAEACEGIWQHVSSISPQLREGVVDKRQACFLPIVSTGGGPLIGAASGMKGLYVGVGHTCWGICNAPGTAKALSELVLDGQISCAKLAKLSPSRYI